MVAIVTRNWEGEDLGGDCVRINLWQGRRKEKRSMRSGDGRF